VLCGLLMLFGFSAAGTIEVGVLYAFISYLGRLNEPLIELTTQQSMLQQAVVAGERVFELMDRPRQAWGADDAPLSSGRVEIDHLSFAYRGIVWSSRISRWIFPPAALWRWSGIPAAGRVPSPV
jgi:ATP-binding cassette subfamily B multidrug efflux pump